MLNKTMYAFFLFFPLSVSQAGDWRGQLQGGGTVTVDPTTNRAMVEVDGVKTQLWQGTHRMKDGSILIVNKGVAVPNESIIESRQLDAPQPQDWEDVQIVGFSPCAKLVQRICGMENQCANGDACSPARQLLEMEESERADSRNRNLMTFTSGQCLNAMKDEEFFTPCKRVLAQEKARQEKAESTGPAGSVTDPR